VRDADGGSSLVGAFTLHPFARFLPWFQALVMLGIAVTVSFKGRGIGTQLFAAFFLLMAIGAALFAFQDRKPQTQEQQQIRTFLENVFSDVR
jgi:hypothetical protein